MVMLTKKKAYCSVWPYYSFLPPFHMLKYMRIKQKCQWMSLCSEHETFIFKIIAFFYTMVLLVHWTGSEAFLDM